MVRLYGFSAEERLFWKDTLPGCEVVEQGGTAQVLLIAGDCCDTEVSPTPCEIQEAEVACVVTGWGGSRRWRSVLKGSFPIIKEYGLLPAADPRVVIPLSLSRHTVAALGLHTPGRTLARVALFLARSLAMLGNRTLLRRRALLIATRQSGLLPSCFAVGSHLAHFDDVFLDYALYLGRADDDRKTVVLPLTGVVPFGLTTPDFILKVAILDKARASLQNEADTLATLAASPLAIHIPKLVDVVDASGVLTISQEYRPRKAVKLRQMNEAVIAFLAGLSRIDRLKQHLAVLLKDILVEECSGLSDKVATACRALYAKLESLSETGTLLWVHRSHGDFASWNCSWSAQGFFVFDWEASRTQDLAFGDVFYYIVAPALLVQRNPSAQKTLDAALCLAHQVAESAGMAEVDCRIYLALWLLGRIGEASLYGELSILLERNWL